MARIDAKRAGRERRDRAASYDEDRAVARLGLLRAQATAGSMRDVLRAPADPAQQAKAEGLLAASLQEAAELATTVGDPDTVIDRAGDLPATRRDRHLREHMRYFRHPTLREWSSGQRQRGRSTLKWPHRAPLIWPRLGLVAVWM